jgi:hypothetical protein
MHAITKVRESKEGHISFWSDNVHLLVENIHTAKNATGTLLDTSKAVVLEVNAEKTYYIFVSQDTMVTQRHPADPLEMWHTSNCWEQNKIKTSLVK